MGVTVRDTRTGALRHFLDARQAKLLVTIGHAEYVEAPQPPNYATRALSADTPARRGRPPKSKEMS